MAELSEEEITKRYNQVYLEIIMKYKDIIEDKENLYVAELPKLVTPDAEDVAALAGMIKGKFPIYRYDENLYDAAVFAYEYVRDSIASISMPVQYWLTPQEVIRCGAGDQFGKVVLLCSLIIALGNISAKVIIAADDEYRKFGVYFKYNDKTYYIDLDSGIKEMKSEDALLESLGAQNRENEGLSVYEFNDKMYRDIL